MDSENILKKEDLKQVLWYMMRPSNDSTEDELKIKNNEKAKKDDNKFGCNQCEASYTNRGSLSKHILAKHRGIKYNCDICEYEALSSGNLKVHRRKNHGITNECNFCQVKFDNLNELEKHKVTAHMGEKKYSCFACDFKSNSEAHMIKHYTLKHEGKLMRGGKYACKHCDYEAKEDRSLKTHQRAKHEGITFDCDLCDYKAGYASQVKSHKLDKHEGIKYECDECEWKTNTKGKLSSHKNVIHQGLRISCEEPECDSQFTTQGAMKGHLMLKHRPGCNPKRCDACKSQFSDSRKLRIHKLQLHGVGEWNNCDKCDYKSASKYAVEKHNQLG